MITPSGSVSRVCLFLIGGATTFPTPPEEGEEQYNSRAWIAYWSNAIEAVYEDEAVIKQKGHTREAAGLQCSQQAKSVWTEIAASLVYAQQHFRSKISSFPSVV